MLGQGLLNFWYYDKLLTEMKLQITCNESGPLTHVGNGFEEFFAGSLGVHMLTTLVTPHFDRQLFIKNIYSKHLVDCFWYFFLIIPTVFIQPLEVKSKTVQFSFYNEMFAQD